MIQDMINSETIWIQLNRQTQTYSRLSKSNMEHPHFPKQKTRKNGAQVCKIHQSSAIFSPMPSQQFDSK